MSNINATFRFHNVGQGLFYSGLLNKKEDKRHKTFSFVYDCGTSSSKLFLKREIDDYKLLLRPKESGKKKMLDLLVVSHLHDDHVNGLEHLLKDIDVDTVVMPYVNEKIKILAQLESDNDDVFLQEFYANPVEWFAAKGVRRIFLVGAGEASNEMRDSDNGQYKSLEGVSRQSILFAERYNKNEETEIVYLSNNSYIVYDDFEWKFFFENLEQDPDKIESYVQKVKDFKLNRRNEQGEPLTLVDIFKSKSLLQELKDEIKSVFSLNILNRTSVVLVHRPIHGRIPFWYSTSYHICSEYYRNWVSLFPMNGEYYSTILTGDLELTEQEELAIFKNSSVFCFVFQYPHHGAKNEGIEFFKEIYAVHTVVSCGILNQYGHPHDEVLRELPYLFIVNEREAFDYQIMV